MVLTKLLGLGPKDPTRKELAAQMAEVRRQIEQTTREISAASIEYARKSTHESKSDTTPTPTSA